jgi:hypothetical protein
LCCHKGGRPIVGHSKAVLSRKRDESGDNIVKDWAAGGLERWRGGG